MDARPVDPADMTCQGKRDVPNDDQTEDPLDGGDQFAIGPLFSLSLRERVGVRRLGELNGLRHAERPHAIPLPEGEGTSASALRTFSTTRSTSIPSMQ